MSRPPVAGGQSILEPLVASTPSSPLPQTVTGAGAPKPKGRRRFLPAHDTRTAEACRRDPVSGLALVSRTQLEEDPRCRRALAAVLSPPATDWRAAAVAPPTSPPFAPARNDDHGAQRVSQVLKTPNADPAGLVKSVLDDSAEAPPRDQQRAAPLLCKGVCPVIVYASLIDLFVASAPTASGAAADAMGQRHGASAARATTSGVDEMGDSHESVTAVPAYLVLSRPYLSVWSPTGELYASCAAHHLTCVARCASHAILLRHLPTAPGDRHHGAPLLAGTDIAFCLADAEETDFFFSTLTRVAQLPQKLARESHSLASRAHLMDVLSGTSPHLDTTTTLTDSAPFAESVDGDRLPWRVLERPYTSLLALTCHTQLVPITACRPVPASRVAQLVPWIVTSVADALDPMRLFRTFIAPRGREGEQTEDEAAPQKERHEKATPSAASVTGVVRQALAMLLVGAMPRPLEPRAETTGRRIKPDGAVSGPDGGALRRRFLVGGNQRHRHAHTAVAGPSVTTSEAPPTYRHDDEEEQWYFSFPEHHDMSGSSQEQSAVQDTSCAFETSSLPHQDRASAVALHDDEAVDVPQEAAVQQLLARIQQQQDMLYTLLKGTQATKQ